MELTLEELARLVQGTVRGDATTRIRGINGLREAGDGEIAFLANRRYAPLLESTRAAAVIVSEGVASPIPAIEVKNPDLAFARIAERLNGRVAPLPPGVHPAASVAPGARLGRDVAVGAHAVVEAGATVGDGAVLHPQVYVGAEAKIGAGALLYPHVVVRERCLVGDRVILHSGAVIGSDGFGFTTDNGVHHKIPQIGIVVVEDDVEIGANTAIDRARFGRTVIGAGTKIDNLVQIAHNVVIGPGSLIAAQAGLSGSTRLGKFVVLAGQVGLAGHLELGDGVIVTAQSGVGKNLPPGTQVTGHHAIESKKYFRQQAALAHLPEALREIKRLKKEVEELRRRLSGGDAGSTAP